MLRRAQIWAITVCATLFSGIAAVVMLLPYWLGSPSSDSPHRADAILVLGSNGGERVPRAVELYGAGSSSNVIVSVGTECSQSIAEGSKAAFDSLRHLGVSETIVTLQTASCNTWAEAHDAAKLMQSRGWRSVIVVTDPPHIRRTGFSFNHAFAHTDLTFTLVSTQPDWWVVGPWWKNDIARQYVQSELLKFAFYWLSANLADAKNAFTVVRLRFIQAFADAPTRDVRLDAQSRLTNRGACG